jgi:hypothetical protein
MITGKIKNQRPHSCALAGEIMAAPFLLAVFKDLGEVPPMMMQ